MSTVDPNARYVEGLEGTGLAIIVTGIVFLALSTVVVGFRAYLRWRERTFGWDDGLMLGGLILYAVDVGLACHGARVGLGAWDVHLNESMKVNAKKFLFLWLMLYQHTHVLVKSSICVTILRIAESKKRFRIAVWGLLGLNICFYFITFVGVVTLCRPIQANWDSSLVATGEAECASMDALMGISYAGTALTIVTDLGCAVLPGLILWGMQMKPRVKILVFLLLSFGSFACITTIIRTPYITHYRTPEDNFPYWTGQLVFWSDIETAVGLIAGSIPSVRIHTWPIFRRTTRDISMEPLDVVTIGSAPNDSRKYRRRDTLKDGNDTALAVTSVHASGQGDWSRLHDDTSDREGSATLV